MIKTANGGRAAVGTELCRYSTTREQRAYILELEQKAAEVRRKLPKRRKPEHEKPGPVTWVQLQG